VLANLVSPGPDSTMLHAASLFHASGLLVLPYWVRGGTAAVLPRFDRDSYLDALARHHATEIQPGADHARHAFCRRRQSGPSRYP
jgi:hypothetical protein